MVAAALGAGDGVRVAKTGRAIPLPGGEARVVALRAELDALPVLERHRRALGVGQRS